MNEFLPDAIKPALARLLRRMLAFGAASLVAVVALYHLTVAGTVVLEARYGVVSAHLIIAGVFAVAMLALIVVGVTARAKALPAVRRTALSERAMRIAMLVEAVLLGYEATRKSRD